MFPGTFARTTPDKPAAISAETGESLTYRQLDERSAQLAGLLLERGLRRGDTVALLTDNQITAFEVYWAALRTGMYLTPVNHHLALDEIAYVVDNCDARAVVVSAAHRDVAAELAQRPSKVVVRLAFGGDVPHHEPYEVAIRAMPADPPADQPAGADMLYSSGTTGRPKGIRGPLPDRQIDEPGDPFVTLFQPFTGIDAEAVFLSPGPIYHAAPLRFSALVHSVGGTVVMMRKFDAEATLRFLESYACTHVQVVPTMFVRMLKLDPPIRTRYGHDRLRCAIHAAAPCPVDVKRAMIEWWGPVLLEYYGATEANGGTVITSPEWLARPGSVGKAMSGVVHICDDDGAELPAGRPGLVYFERATRPFEYHGDPEKTAQSRHPQHATWTSVGDMGYVDEDGYLFLTDRKNFMIISGGVNVYPQEVENALTLHPKVSDVAVFGIPDPEMGQQVKAAVVPAPGVDAAGLDRELIDFLRARIAHFKVPRSVDFVDELPRTPAGKLAKQQLIDRYATAQRA